MRDLSKKPQRTLRWHKLIVALVFLSGIVTILSPLTKLTAVKAAGNVTGRVFQDFNANGTYDTSGSATLPAIDKGVAGVRVTAYDSAGASAFADTIADGTYTINTNTLNAGPYRIEFTNLPTGYKPSARSTDSTGTAGRTATNAGSTVQWVTAGGIGNVNLAINHPEDYCQNNPSLCAPIQRPGNQSGTRSTVVTFPYNAPATVTARANETQTGTVWGLAYQRNSKTVFMSAMLKRHAGFGTLGTGGIYKVNATTGTPSNYVDVQTIGINTGANPRTTAGYTLPATGATPHWDYAAYDKVGKVSIGDMDYDEQRNTLWFVNLNDRRLHGIANVNPNVTPTSADVRKDGSNNAGFAINTTPAITCTNGVLRPWGLTVYRGLVYVGAICSGENTGATTANLVSYVLSFNPDNSAAGFTQVLSFPINYARTKTTFGGNAPWNPWVSSDSNRNFALAIGDLSQPIVADLEFDNDGSLVMGILDRWGDQVAANQYLPDTAQSNTGLVGEIYGFGDILRFCKSGATFANPGTASCPNNARPATENGVNAGGSQGPGGGEFYSSDFGPADADEFGEVAHGGLAFLPGSNRVMTTTHDANNWFTNGVMWLSNTNGTSLGRFDLYTGSSLNTTNDFNKGNGLGDIELLCDSAPIEIGNRVWNDINGNGAQDPGEAPISGVTVRLYDSTNTLVGTAVTAATTGEYYFVGSTAADPNTTDNIGQVNGGISLNSKYEVRFDRAQDYQTGGALVGKYLTLANETAQPGDDDSSDSDARLVTNPTNSPAGTFPVVVVNTGAAGSNSHTFDVGFSNSAPTGTFSLGNRLWLDTNNNGAIDSAEVGLNNVSLTLLTGTGAVYDSDGNAGNGVQPYNLTTANGGYYRFDNLPAGDYKVRVNSTNFATGNPLAAFANTSGNVTTDLDSTTLEAGENGVDPTSYNGTNAGSPRQAGIVSNTVTLGAGVTEPLNETNLGTGDTTRSDGLTDLTIDVGFFCLALNGILWQDNGAGANNNNGRLDAGESGISSMRVQLYDSANVEIPVGPDGILGTADDANGGMFTVGGNYSFQGLQPGDYRVVVTPSGATSSTDIGTTAAPNNNVDSDDNGVTGSAPFTGKVVSNLVTLTPGNAGALNNNSVNNSTGITTNPTIDFGFVNGPTAVKLADLHAFVDKKGVSIAWRSGYEVDNLGYRVYREVNGEKVPLNKELVAGSVLQVGAGVSLPAGYAYRVIDREMSKANVFAASYWLEAVDLDGSTEWFGPVSAGMVNSDVAEFVSLPESPILSDLGRNARNDAARQTESAMRPSVSSRTNAVNTSVRPQNNGYKLAGDGRALKIEVSQNGWYEISPAQLTQAGFDVNGNRQNWQLWSGLTEQSIKVGADGTLSFYGQAQDTIQTDGRVYWLIEGRTAGKRVSVSQTGFNPSIPNGWFMNSVLKRDRVMRVNSVLNGDAENFYAAIISQTASNQELTLREVASESGAEAQLEVIVNGLTIQPHSVKVLLNGTEMGIMNFDGTERKTMRFPVSLSLLREGANTVTLQSVGGSSDVNLLESIRVNYPRRFKAFNNRLEFSAGAGQAVKLEGLANNAARVFDITNPANVSEVEATGAQQPDGSFAITLDAGSTNRVLVAQTVQTTALQPRSVKLNRASSWMKAGNQADLIILAPRELHPAIEPLKARRESEGLSVVVIDIEDIFDEFGSGERSAAAVKEFFRNAYNSWSNPKPRYVLLVGDASTDPRNYTGQGGTAIDLVPTLQVETNTMETTSDEALVDFNNDAVGEMMIGRLPVRTAAEAELQINKLLNANMININNLGGRGSLLVADLPLGYDFAGSNQLLQTNVLTMMTPRFVNRADGDIPTVRQQIIEQLNSGAAAVNFFGHGTVGLWTGGGMIRSIDVENLTNGTRMPLVMSTTCMNGTYAEPGVNPIAKAFMKSPNGGAFAVIASSGMPNAEPEDFMARQMWQTVIRGERLGDSLRQGKLATEDRTVRLSYHLFGDPSAKLYVNSVTR
jgi:hypothetical protein